MSEHLDEVLAMARNCLASEVVQRALRSGRWWREVGFVVPGVGSGNEGVSSEASYITGRVDMVFHDGEGLVVVDYKSDLVPASDVRAAIATHRGQAEIYALGVDAATGLTLSNVVFVFARPGAEGRTGALR